MPGRINYKPYSKIFRVYDFGLSNNENFFLTKVNQIYSAHVFLHGESGVFAYISSYLLRTLF